MNDVSTTTSALYLWQKLGYKCRLTWSATKGITRISTQHKGNGHEKPVYIDIPDDQIDDIPFIKSEFDKAFADLELAISEVQEILDEIKVMQVQAGFE